MKKIALTVLMLLLSFYLTACGNGDEGKSEAKDKTTTIESETGMTTAETEKQGEKEDASDMQKSESQAKDDAAEPTTARRKNSYTMEEYMGMMQETVAEMSALMKDSGLAVSLEARGKSLVYVYQYTVDVGDSDAVREALDESMSSMDETNRTLLADLKKAVPDADSLICEYLDMDGDVITSAEYK